MLLQDQPSSPASSSPGPLAWLGPEPDQRVLEDGGADGGSRIIQMTREMATEVLLMAQSLRRGGRILVTWPSVVVEGLGALGAVSPLWLPAGAGTDQTGQLPESKGHAPG